MLRMDHCEHERTGYRVYNQSISEISRTTGHSRNTIRKALKNEYYCYPARKKQASQCWEHLPKVSCVMIGSRLYLTH